MAAKNKIAQKLAMARWHYFSCQKKCANSCFSNCPTTCVFEAIKTLFKSSSKIAIRRLINIELAHLWLMQQAIKSCASWAIIIEDDAVCDNIADLADGLLAVIRSPIEASYYQSLTILHSSPVECRQALEH
jgi:ethanolamine utilization cobalamin adenosyltransferase